MIRTFLIILIGVLLYEPVIALGASQDTELTTPVQVVLAFQRVPHYEMFCHVEDEGGAEPLKVGEKFKSYLSKDFYKLFLWSQCVEPEIPPHYVEIHAIYWDIRFGSGHGYGGTYPVANIRIKLAKQGIDKAIVKVLFDPVAFPLKNITTTYTLIREDGHWKIDDIAPQGDFRKDDEDYDTMLEHSDSIKTDMQNNYNAAAARYEQEQSKKNAVTKP